MSFIDKRSGKRFHRKNFTKHVVNDYRLQRDNKEMGLPNKKRFELRAKAREEVRNIRKEVGM